MVEGLAAWRDVVWEVLRSPNGRAALWLVLRYISTLLGPTGAPELVSRLREALGPGLEEEIVSLIDYYEEQGRLKGQRSMLLKLLTARFGALPDAVVTRIHQADAARLDGWATRMATASSLEEVLGEPWVD